MTRPQTRPGRRPAAYAHRSQPHWRTRHAVQRLAERNITVAASELTLEEGTYHRTENGCWRRQLQWFQLTQLLRRGVDIEVLEDAVGVYAITCPDDEAVVTFARDTSKARAGQYRSWLISLRQCAGSRWRA